MRALLTKSNTYLVNGKELTAEEAQAIFRLKDREYKKEDVISNISGFYKIDREDVVNVMGEDLIESITSCFIEAQEDDDGWIYCLRYAIEQFKSEIEDKMKDKERKAV